MAARPIIFASIFFTAMTSVAHAGTVLFGPTPYRGSADSPFELSGLGTTFWLEDFEDGELNTPGVWHPFLEFNSDAIRGPATDTDSVDADDGIIDGDGYLGHSFQAFDEICTSQTCHRNAFFVVDPKVLGGYPSAVGIVITDASVPSSLFRNAGISALDVDGNVIAQVSARNLGDASVIGNTTDDYFFGIQADQGIATLAVSDIPGWNLELDHLQYGQIVPEPSTFGLCLIIATFAILYHPARKASHEDEIALSRVGKARQRG